MFYFSTSCDQAQGQIAVRYGVEYRPWRRIRTIFEGSGHTRDVTWEPDKPFNRVHVLYQRSLQKLPEYKASQNMAGYVASVTRLPETEDGSSSDLSLPTKITNSICALIKMFDFSLFKSLTFDIICLSCVLIFIDEFRLFLNKSCVVLYSALLLIYIFFIFVLCVNPKIITSKCYDAFKHLPVCSLHLFTCDKRQYIWEVAFLLLIH